MKITALESQKNDKNRLNLFVDDAFRYGLSIATAARLGLYAGRDITKSELQQISNEDDYQKCLNSALNLASRRMQAEKEYWQKLGKRYESSVVGRCIERLRVLGYANDKLFAEMWVRERGNTHGYVALRNELRLKGVDDEIISTLLVEEHTDQALENAIHLGAKKYSLDRDKSANMTRVLSYLTRRGYSYSVSMKAFEIIEKTNRVTD